MGSFQLSRFEIAVQEAVQEHNATPLGKFERELEDKFGIQDLVPRALEKEYNKRVARREIRFDQHGQPVFTLKDNDETRLLSFRQFARRNFFLFAGVAIAIASAVTAAILVTRQALRKAGKRLKREEVIPSNKIVPVQGGESGGGQIVPNTLDSVSNNLLTVVGAILFLLFLSRN